MPILVFVLIAVSLISDLQIRSPLVIEYERRLQQNFKLIGETFLIQHGVRQLGTKVSPESTTTILDKGHSYHVTTTILIGMLFACIPSSALTTAITAMLVKIGMTIILLAFIAYIISANIISRITKPLKILLKDITAIAEDEGDLTK